MAGRHSVVCLSSLLSSRTTDFVRTCCADKGDRPDENVYDKRTAMWLSYVEGVRLGLDGTVRTCHTDKGPVRTRRVRHTNRIVGPYVQGG